MLLDRDGVVGAAFDGRVVGDDEHLATRHPADARNDPGAGRLLVVQLPGCQRRELEKRRAFVDQAIDALADGHLALLAMPLQIALAAALARPADAFAQLRDEGRHLVAISRELRAVSSGV